MIIYYKYKPFQIFYQFMLIHATRVQMYVKMFYVHIAVASATDR